MTTATMFKRPNFIPASRPDVGQQQLHRPLTAREGVPLDKAYKEPLYLGRAAPWARESYVQTGQTPSYAPVVDQRDSQTPVRVLVRNCLIYGYNRKEFNNMNTKHEVNFKPQSEV